MSVWLGNILLTRASPDPSQLVLYGQRRQKQPGYLATHLLCPQATVKLYRLRLWIEEMLVTSINMALTWKLLTYLISCVCLD